MNEAPGPHEVAVNLIVAATSDPVRRELLELTQDAHFTVRAVARDSLGLAELLRQDVGARVVTGGSLSGVRPFLRTSRTANAAAVAVLSGGAPAADRSSLGYGGLALLRSMPPTDAFQAAVIASSAGLSVWDPDLALPPAATESREAPLSPRERTVLQLTGAGQSTKAVARELGISPNTVKFHLRAAYEKLGVASRAQAVMAAIRRGELSV